MTDKIWRVAIWCAVSSKPQAADDKVSLESQEQAGRQFAAAIEGHVVAVYTVPGHTRDYWSWYEAEADIAAYRQVRQALEAGDVDVVHCVDSDRLGRDPALVSQFYSLAERCHAEIYDASMPHPLGHQSTGHRYGVQVKSVSVGEDQRRRARRHHMGMKGRIERRGLLPGLPPFYLDPIREPSTGETIAYQFSDQVAALDLMTRLFLAGHSYEEMRRRLDSSPHPPPKGRAWWHDTIHSTMQSDIPAGIPTWGAYRAQQPSDKIPARWDPATHQAVIKERRRRKAGYHRRRASALYGVAFCQRCGGRMVRTWMANVNRHYLRCGRHTIKARRPEYACHANNIAEAAVIQEVAAFLQWLTGPGVLDRVLADQGDSAEVEQMQQDLDRALFAIENIQARKIRAGHAFAAGDMEISVYRQVDADLSNQLAAEQSTVDELTRALESVPDREQRRATLEELSHSFPELLERKEPAEVATLLQSVGLRVYIEDRTVQRIRIE